MSRYLIQRLTENPKSELDSDYWRGTAAELARRSAIGVYPIGGGGKRIRHTSDTAGPSATRSL